MSTSLVSIIIPTYNRAHLISETLDSILAQSYQNWECIIVDDGSTDNTSEIVGNYVVEDSRFKYYSRPTDRPKGANACRNYGFELSQGEYVNWFDDDDLMMPEKIEIQVFHLQKNLNIKICITQGLFFKDDKRNTLSLRKQNFEPLKILDDVITEKCKLLTPLALISTDFVKKNKLIFDESLHQSQEWDYFVRLLYCNSDFNLVKKPLVLIRAHTNNISNSDKTEEKIVSNFMTRYKVLCMDMSLCSSTVKILDIFLIKRYKELLVNKYFFSALKVRKLLKKRDSGLVMNFKIDLALVSFFLFRRGEFLLK